MELSNWLTHEHGRQVRLARCLNLKPPVVAAWITGRRPIPVGHGAAIEAFTGGEVTRQEMFPNDWRRIWPELAPATEATATTHHPDAAQPAEQGVANA